MGNVPSKEPQGRPPHKLSKPRVVSSTTTTASTLPPSPSNGHPTTNPLPPLDKSHHLISIPYSEIANSESPDDNDDLYALEGSDKPSFLIPPKVQRRLSLFRSKSSQETSERRKSRRNTVIGSPSPVSGDSAIVRANSVSTHHATGEPPNSLGLSIPEGYTRFSILQPPFPRLTICRLPPTGSRASWAYDLSSYEAQRILNLVRDQPTPLPRSQTSTSLVELDQEERRARASRRVSLPIQPESAPITRSNSEMSLHPPMRRRSLIQTPGVATRTRPSPPSMKSVKSSFRHSHPPTPSMSRQPSLESNDGHFLSLPPLPSSGNDVGSLYRVLTPKDTDYSTTGAFKLGTLRITNGSPDMTPHVTAALEAVDEQGASDDIQGDYFSKGPSSESANTNLTSLSQFSSQTGEHQNSSVSVSEPGQVMLGSNPPDLSISVPNQDLNDHYSSELQLSPDEMSAHSSRSPTLKTQSRQAAVDDHLFDDDDALEISVVEVLDVRIDASAKSLPPHVLEPIQFGTKGVQRTDSGFVSNSKSESSQSYSSLAKADSGYSSNVSLRSLRSGRKPAAAEREPRTSIDSDSGSPQRQGECLPSNSNEPTSETAQPEKAPTPPPKDDAFTAKEVAMSPVKNTQDGDTPSMTTKPTQSRRKSVRQQTANVGTTQPEDGRDQPSETSTPTSATRTSETSSSSLSIGNNSQRPGRLQRLLSLRSSTFSKQALTVHVTHAVDNDRVPSIPKDVEEKLRERTGLFPMTTKRLALKNQMSKETLKTILSVGSLELSREDEMPAPEPISSEHKERGTEVSDSADNKDTSLKTTFNSMQSNFRHAAMSAISTRNSASRRSIPSRAESQKTSPEMLGKDDTMLPTEAELTSYQSINSTLGNNAYDLAARALHTPVQTQPNRSENVRLSTRSALNETPSPPKHRSSPPVSMTTRGSFRSPPPRSPLSPQGPAVLRAKTRAETTQHVATYQGTSHQVPEGFRRGRSASGFQYRAASCGPTPRRMSVGSYGTPPPISRHTSISSVQSDLNRGGRDDRFNAQNPTELDLRLKRQASLDGCSGTELSAHLAQPAHRGPSARPGWNPQNSSHAVGGQFWNQPAWVPPYVPRESHRRNLSAGSRPYNQGAGQAPYRILHSYNSPAYRNAPIWG